MSIRAEVLKYSDLYLRVCHTGSRVICDPAPQDTDDDYILLCTDDNSKQLINKLFDDHYALGGSVEQVLNVQGIIRNPSAFQSYKHPATKVNLLVTSDPNFFWSFVRATALAKKLNLLKKEDRITLFEAVNGDVWPEIDVD